MSLDTYLSVCYNNIAHFGCCCGISWRVSSASVSPPCKNQGNLNWLCKSWHNHFQLSIFNFQFNKQVWRNWLTRMVQVHVKAISCRFKSCFPHLRKKAQQKRWASFFVNSGNGLEDAAILKPVGFKNGADYQSSECVLTASFSPIFFWSHNPYCSLFFRAESIWSFKFG